MKCNWFKNEILFIINLFQWNELINNDILNFDRPTNIVLVNNLNAKEIRQIKENKGRWRCLALFNIRKSKYTMRKKRNIKTTSNKIKLALQTIEIIKIHII